MARNRMIKPEFWRSVQVSDLSVTARLLFIGMWNFADDGGNQPYDSRRLKMAIFPGDSFDDTMISGWLEELISEGLVETYNVGVTVFTHITGWHHQYIQKPTFTYPPPPGSDTPIVPLPDRSGQNGTERNGTELKGIENVRTFAPVRDLGEINWKEVQEAKDHSNAHIESVWKCNRLGPKFQEKLAYACVLVVEGVLPKEWLREAVVGMLDQNRRSPAGWLGKVLAATAAERGVDFDAYQRAIELPAKGGE